LCTFALLLPSTKSLIMKYYGERLKMARVMKGWSMQDLVDKLDGKISKSAISKYENAERIPSRANLNLIAELLNVKLDYFFRREKLEINPEFRKLAKLPKKKQNEVLELTRDYLERYLEIENLTGFERKFQNPLKDLKISSLEDAEKAAQNFRRAFKLGSDPIYNIVEHMEEWGIKVFHFSFGIESISGMSSWIEDGNAAIVINKDHNIDRQRFTAFHELAHLVLNISDELEAKTKERICDRFAGALILPKESLISELGSNRKSIHLKELTLIKKQYGISPQAIVYRSKDCGIISEYLFKSLMINMSKRFGRKKSIGFYDGIEESNRMLQLLCMGIAEDAFTMSKASSLYNKTLSEFRKDLRIQTDM